MIQVTALLLDLAYIAGGFLLSAVLLSDLPRGGPWIARAARGIARSTLVVGHVVHVELVGIGRP